MAIARITDLEDAHRDYCRLYWEVNELQLIGTQACRQEARRLEREMAQLVDFLGYVPQP